MSRKVKAQNEKRDKRWERLESIISRDFSACYMSTAKWVKLLKTSCSFSSSVPLMSYKLVYSDEVKSVATELYEEQIDEYWFIEPSIYKEIEWLEFPFIGNQKLEELGSAFNKLANFPITYTSTGLRVIGYEKA